MRKINILIYSAVFLLMTFGISWAVPPFIFYQGKLSDKGNMPMNDTVNMTFSIWLDSSLTSSELKVWSETHNDVVITEGQYSVFLGSGIQDLGTFGPGIFSSNDTWLEVSVNGEVLQPRQKIVSSGFAIRAGEVDQLPDHSITADKIGEDCGIGEVLIMTATGWACGTWPYTP